jgi:hypothetical protein
MAKAKTTIAKAKIIKAKIIKAKTIKVKTIKAKAYVAHRVRSLERVFPSLPSASVPTGSSNADVRRLESRDDR